jgi:hypothetical protein
LKLALEGREWTIYGPRDRARCAAARSGGSAENLSASALFVFQCRLYALLVGAGRRPAAILSTPIAPGMSLRRPTPTYRPRSRFSPSFFRSKRVSERNMSAPRAEFSLFSAFSATFVCNSSLFHLHRLSLRRSKKLSPAKSARRSVQIGLEVERLEQRAALAIFSVFKSMFPLVF